MTVALIRSRGERRNDDHPRSLPKPEAIKSGGHRVQPVRGQRPADPKIHEHLAYLKRMVIDGVIDAGLANVARTVWYATWVETGGDLPVPAAAAFPGGPVEYHWEFGPHQLSIEIPADEPCHWFYRNKATGGTWGVEAPIIDGVPPQFLAYLQRLLPSAG
jgi:hypothetical protein